MIDREAVEGRKHKAYVTLAPAVSVSPTTALLGKNWICQIAFLPGSIQKVEVSQNKPLNPFYPGATTDH